MPYILGVVFAAVWDKAASRYCVVNQILCGNTKHSYVVFAAVWDKAHARSTGTK